MECLSLLISVDLLSAVLDAKPGKPSKPIKPIKPVPTKEPKPATPLPPTLATIILPEPVSPEGLRANTMFDEMVFATLPGCLVCLNQCILPGYNTPETHQSACYVIWRRQTLVFLLVVSHGQQKSLNYLVFTFKDLPALHLLEPTPALACRTPVSYKDKA